MVNPPEGTTIASIQPFKYKCPAMINAKPTTSKNKGNAR